MRPTAEMLGALADATSTTSGRDHAARLECRRPRRRCRGSATGPGNADFNGFNTSVESVLSDNRTQFLDGVASARDRLNLLRIIGIALPALAAALTFLGFQRRIAEYYR